MTYKYLPLLPLTALAALLLTPSVVCAQSILLTANDFVLLGGTAVTVGGAGPNTYSNGNVGSDASISGFPPATVVNGSTILGGPIVGQALIDLGSARDKLNALVAPPANNLTGQDLGGMTLAPGVYKYDVAAEITLAGTKILTLDAQGKNNVVWVFNIGTTLTTAAGAQVQFINLGTNGGADNGLFWNAGTSITFGAANVIAGNYLAAENITVGTTIPADGAGSGRALAHAIVSFEGEGTMDVLGGPGGGDMTGGLADDGNGNLVSSGYVLLSANGTYVQGDSSVMLRNGTLFNTTNVIVDGNSSDTAPNSPATLTVFQTIASLTGTNTYTGGTIVDAGTLTAGSANLPVGGDVSLIDSNATGTPGALILDQDTNGTYTGVISGTGSVTKEGSGILMLTGTHTHTGGTFLNEGALVLNNAVLRNTTLASGTFLGGNGTINGDLLNAGTVSPGFSPGTIIVVGNYTQTAAGTLVVEIASPISYDQLIVGGTATLDGTLQVDILGGYNPAGQSFDILTAAGGVAGTFSAVTGSAALQANVTYNANDVTVSFVQTPFTVFAGTPNQVAIANAALMTPAVTTALNGVPTAGELPAALNALSPQGYQIWSDIAFARSLSLSERLSRDSNATVGHDDYYFQVGQSRNSAQGDMDVGSDRFNSDSGLVGGDHALNENFTLGGFLDYTESEAGLGSSGSNTKVKSIMPGIRATWRKDAWFANAAVGYGFDNYESKRVIAFTGTNATAKSHTKGRQWLMNVTAGRHFEAGPVTLSPFGGLLASSWKADGFNETGAGALNNTVGSQRARSLRTQLGLESSINLTLGTIGLRPHVRAAWIHELSNDSRDMDASFGGTNYTIATRRPTRDSARLSAGFDASLSETVSLYADYGIQTGDTTRVIGEWNAGLSMRF